MKSAFSFFDGTFFRHFLMVLICFCSIDAAAQLPPFTLNVTPTVETCSGNGSLNFSTSGTVPGADVEFRIFKLPDLTNPIAVLATGFLGGLTSGTYHVVATQSLNGESSQQSQDVDITSNIVNLAYTISGTNSNCTNNGTITVNVFSGTANLFEIISGPVTMPTQSSNHFENLPAGIYEIRVFDTCGEGWVATFTLLPESGPIGISPASFPDTILPSCNTVTVSNTLTSPQASMAYPLNLTYTVHPPDGSADIVLNNIVTTGNPETQDVEMQIPFYNDQMYTYDLVITDACGNTYSQNSILVNLRFVSEIRIPMASCGQHFLNIASANFVAPLTINFTQYPAGFDPIAFNPTHPGPFYSDSIDYGSSTMPVPFGEYTAEITDACGRTVIATVDFIFEPAIPAVDMIPYPGCQSNFSEVTFTISGYTIVSAIITVAPATYTFALPSDVSSYAQPEGTVVVPMLPTGNYTIVLTDECGNVYTKDFFVPDTATSVTATTRTGCGTGFGSVRIRGSNTVLTTAVMVAAPAGFPNSIPYNVGFNIGSTGIFSMAGLIPGNYTFEVDDNCGIHHSVNIAVTGFLETVNTYSITPHCGSFDLYFSNVSNASVAPSFWLQKKNPLTGLWGHPETGVNYTEGTTPTTANSYPIINNQTNYNISYLGDFRVIRTYESFNNGSIGPFIDCVDVIHEFTFTNGLAITNIEKTTCNGQYSDVLVTATGIAPLTYQVTSQNGAPFFIDNGTSNVFSNLNAAIYNFRVLDACGNVVNQLADVALLPSLAQAHPAPDMIMCDDSVGNGMALFDLAAQNGYVLGGQNPANFTITYYTTLGNANSETDPLPLQYLSGNAQLFARLEFNGGSNCFDIATFNLIVNPYPASTVGGTYDICPNNTVTISTGENFESYNWSTGETTPTITVDTAGTYSVVITKDGCEATLTYTVNPAEPPQLDHIETTDWTENSNSITIVLTNAAAGQFVFSLDGTHFQTSNVFEGLPAGAYTIYVHDTSGCGDITVTTYLLNYPHFFTPNGDGHNDFWQIRFSSAEPEMKIYIFDRYGKFLKQLSPMGQGWDGTYNGQSLPSTDYWFLVERADGVSKRGHFAMKR